jgi:hypothetical protein
VGGLFYINKGEIMASKSWIIDPKYYPNNDPDNCVLEVKITTTDGEPPYISSGGAGAETNMNPSKTYIKMKENGLIRTIYLNVDEMCGDLSTPGGMVLDGSGNLSTSASGLMIFYFSPESMTFNVRFSLQGSDIKLGIQDESAAVDFGGGPGGYGYGPLFTYSTPFVLAAAAPADLTDLALSASTVAENAGNVMIGSLTPTGGVAPYTYSLVGGNGYLFEIKNSNELWAKASFDYENMPAGAIGKTLSVRIRVASGSDMFQKDFNINVTNVTEGAVLPTAGADAPVLVGSVVVGTVIADPRTAGGVTYNGDPLPAGSVLRNTTTGQKFIAGGTSTTDFSAIEITPPAEWGYSAGGEAAWEVLQDL